ncbi:MAG: hypothetical protein J6V88_04725, partial [Kiritimatiellae bacterium]|nr:hypothetical protein [Kiritimatiellia bacterium]
MKKMISIVMAFVTAIAIAVEFPQVVIQREAIKNSQHLFYQNRWGTVAFLGGSITEMNGYRPLVMEVLKKRFPNANLKCINAGISSTCSDTGAFRLETDVLLKDNIVPDLLFVEYAVNDDQDGFAVTTEDKEVVALRARRSMEGIIRHARMANPNMDIVMVLFVNSKQLKMIQAGKMPLSYTEHLKVAEYYGIPTINVGSALAKGIAEGTWTWKKYRDCHPSPEGNKMVAEKVESLLKKEWGKISPKIIAHKMPEPMDKNAYCCGRFLPISEVKIGEGWNKSVPDWANIKGTVRDNCKKDVILWSTTPGATCEFEFTGNAFGVYVLAGPDAGVIEASVDGKEFKEYALTTPYSSFHYPYTKVLEDGLEKGKHKVTLRVSKKAGPNGGTAVRIFRVCINGTYESFFNVLCHEHRSAAEQMMLFNSEAAKRFLADMKGNPKYDYAKYAPKIEALIAKENEVRATLGTPTYQIACQEVGGRWSRKLPKDVKPMLVAEAVKLVADYREAMLANPILDFEKLLCVRRQIPRPRTPIGGKDCGFLSINAHNHFDLWYKGIQNDIVAISDFKTTNPKYESLYEPKEASIVKDLELDYDASRILFTGWRGTNRLYGVYEIPVTGSKTPTEVSPSKHKDISWWDACYLPNKDQVIFLGTAAYQFLPCEDGNMAMAVLYRYDRKTGEIRQLTYEQDSDYMPSITHDGRILYTRWEYSDLPHYFSRILMTMNPDGIGQLALWGSGSMMPTFFGCARCVPNDPHKITMYGGGHHEAGEVGRMFMIDPTLARAYPFRYDPPDREWGP